MKKILLLRVMSDNRGDDLIAYSIHKQLEKYDVKIDELSLKYFITITDIDKINKNYDGIIFGGSGIFVNHYLKSGFYFNCSVDLFDKITIPIFLIGIGINNNYEKSRYGELKRITVNSIKKLINMSKLLWVRDKNTSDILDSFDVSSIIGGCPALMSGAFVDTNKQFFTISLGENGDFIKLFEDKILNFYIKIIEHINQMEFSVKQICHKNIDINWFNKIKEKIPNSNFDFKIAKDSKKLIKYYAHSIGNIGLYLHSNICAYSCFIPIFILGYDEKCNSFYDTYCSKESCEFSDIRKLDVNKTINFIDKLIENKNKEYDKSSLYKIREIQTNLFKYIWENLK